jgi:hypothetical protein
VKTGELRLHYPPKGNPDMPRKPNRPPKWRRAFLRALSQTANVTLSAQLAGVDKTTAYHVRKRSLLFARLWEQAKADGRAAIDSGAALPDARELVQRPLSIRHSKHGKPCILAAGEGRWSDIVETEYLAQLAASANFARAAAAVGFSTVAISNRRMKDAGFAARCKAALEHGYLRIEAALIHSAVASMEGLPVDDDSPIPQMTPAEAMNLIKLHRYAVHGGKPQRYDWRAKEPDIEEVRQEILRRVTAIDAVKGNVISTDDV